MTKIDIFQVIYDDLKEQSESNNSVEIIEVAQAELNNALRQNMFTTWEANERQLAISTFKYDYSDD